jgi:protein O-GlcNAc transferase
VPTVTLRGSTAVGRGGVSILSNVGLTDWIAEDPRHYVSIARQMSADLPRLSQLRASLRGRMQRSPLMDGAAFARNVEAAYRQIWRARAADSPERAV